MKFKNNILIKKVVALCSMHFGLFAIILLSQKGKMLSFHYFFLDYE